jgi:hypothetical protein
MKVQKQLKDHVAANENISHVYFNKQGEWLYHPRQGYNKEVERSAILKAEIEETKSDEIALSPEIVELLSKLTSAQLQAIISPEKNK